MTRIIPLDDLPRIAAGVPSGPGEPAADWASQHQAIAGGVITIGNFDGVHRGHATLLRQVRELADRYDCPAIAVVLDPHPATLLRPDLAHRRLTRIERRAELMSRHGIDALVVCSTTVDFLQLTADQFFESLVVKGLQAVAMLEGPNFFFGRDRGGDVQVLQQLCQRHQVELRIVEPAWQDEEMISSTRIRRLLESGDVRASASLLGSDYRIRGRVAKGAQRGRQIGFPTANLTDIDVVVPAPGVYGGYACVEGCETPLAAAIHIGPNPTFESEGDFKVEIHLLDYDGDLYDEMLLVDFVTHVRDIARFNSADDLIEQLKKDINTIRSRLAADHP